MDEWGGDILHHRTPCAVEKLGGAGWGQISPRASVSEGEQLHCASLLSSPGFYLPLFLIMFLFINLIIIILVFCFCSWVIFLLLNLPYLNPQVLQFFYSPPHPAEGGVGGWGVR